MPQWTTPLPTIVSWFYFFSCAAINSSDKFIDALRDYINRRQDLSSVNRHQMISCPFILWILNDHEKQLLESARKLQMKAAKSDLVFRMVDSFNRNTVQATVTWKLTNVFKGNRNGQLWSIEKKASLNVLPYFHTINHFYPTVLFSLETSDTKYEDQNDSRTLSSFFQKKSRFRHHLLQHACCEGHPLALHLHCSSRHHIPTCGWRGIGRKMDWTELELETFRERGYEDAGAYGGDVRRVEEEVGGSCGTVSGVRVVFAIIIRDEFWEFAADVSDHEACEYGLSVGDLLAGAHDQRWSARDVHVVV